MKSGTFEPFFTKTVPRHVLQILNTAYPSTMNKWQGKEGQLGPPEQKRLIQMPRMLITGRREAQAKVRQNVSPESALPPHFHTRHLGL